MTQRQAHVIIKRFRKLQQWERGNWMLLNIFMASMAIVAEWKQSPWYLVGALVLVLFIGPRYYRLYAKKQRQLLTTNVVALPPAWDQRVAVFTRFAGWQFIMYILYVVPLWLPAAWAYPLIGILYLGSAVLEWRARRKQLEVVWYLEAYQPQ